jgi:DinB superfamily
MVFRRTTPDTDLYYASNRKKVAATKFGLSWFLPKIMGIARQQLESFGRGPALLAGALRRFPRQMWLYKPSPEKWSIHEIILHLADREVGSYVQCRHFIAEPDGSIVDFNPARWASALGYFHQSTREALKIIPRLRRMTYELLAALPEHIWDYQAQRSAEGSLDLTQWIEMQERHIPRYIDQMKDIHDIWLRIVPRRKPATRYWHPYSSLNQLDRYPNRFKRQNKSAPE